MIEINQFFTKLKKSMENHAQDLNKGDLFLPQYLSRHTLTNKIFPRVANTLAANLGLDITSEYRNVMPPPDEYECGNFQRVDYFLRRGDEPKFFLELESLDRAQLYTFLDHEGISEDDNDNKLWYYYGTLVNSADFGQKVPKYLVFLVILPNCRVEPYQIWDVTPEYKFFHPSLKKLIYESPYKFYDHLIKSAARLFISKEHGFKGPSARKWTKKTLTQLQDVCELVFITCTGSQLVMSRGRDRFDPKKEISIRLNLTE
jgi:hypothetical protein